MPIPPQKNGKIIKPGNDTLKLDTVHKEHRHRRFVFSHVVQEYVLNILRLLIGHGPIPSSCDAQIQNDGSWLGRRRFQCISPKSGP
jgi:hypothetical protein